MAGEYAALEAHLAARVEAGQFRVTLKFGQIMDIIGRALPPEARRDRSFWEDLTRARQKFARPVLGGWQASLDVERQAVMFHNSWSERRREDLADKYAIIVSLPHARLEPHGERPREPLRWDDPDFSQHEAYFRREFDRLLGEALRRHAPGPDEIAIHEHEYEVGPTAQNWPMWLFQLDLGTAANVIEVTTFLYLVARFTIRRYRQWLQERGLRPEAASQLTFTKPILAAMCEGHIRERYHPRATIATAAHGIDDLSSFENQHHPGGHEVYVIDCRVGRKTYTFQIDGHAAVQSFVLREGKVTAVLPLPNWMAEGPPAKRDI